MVFNNTQEAERQDEYTFREQLLLSRFKVLIFDIVEKWSKSYQRGLKYYNDKQTITLELWTNGYKWVKSNKPMLSIELDNSIEYCIPAEDETKITNFDIEVMNKLQWYSFDQYKKSIQYLVCHITN